MKYFLIIVAFLTLSFQVYAQELASPVKAKTKFSYDNLPKLNREVTLTKADFEAQTRVISQDVAANPSLSFQIRLPSDWVKLNAVGGDSALTGKQIFGEIVQYLGPPLVDKRVIFRVRASSLQYDITAKDWFLGYINDNTYNLQGMDVTSDKRVQGQYILVDNGAQKIVRAVAEISGSQILLAETVVPVELWETNRDVVKRSMATFQLTNPDKSTVEVLQTYSFVDIAKFSYPVSWVLTAPPIVSIERMSAFLTNIRGGAGQDKKSYERVLIDGRIDISVVSRAADTTLPKEIENIKKQLLERGLVVGSLIEPVEGWVHNANIKSSHIEVYNLNSVNNKLADYEQWIGVFVTPGRYYFIRMLTVGRNNDLITWARNVKSYKTVIETLSPVQKTGPN